MPAPTNVAELRTFLGSVNYLAQFLPNLSTLATPLRSLLHKGADFNWSPYCTEVFNKLKNLITSAPILAYFDVGKPVIIQCDASQRGIGAALIQEGHPIAFTSRSMTPTEERYAQIEKEMLAVLVACEKFDNFIYGLPHIIVHSDHKPLEAILKKSINDAPRRLQRMLLRLQKYNVEIQYRPGKEMWIADLLSRLFSKEENKPSAFALKLESVPIDAELALSPNALQRLRDASAQDSEIQEILEGNIPSRYSSVKADIATKDGLAFKSGRLIVPVALRKEALEQLHIGHKGICSTQRLARETFYWPGINADIQQLISRCHVCASIGPTQAKEPLQQHEVPNSPWQKIGMDYFEFEGKPYLIMIDYFSNWIEVDPMPSMNTQALIDTCRKHFSRYGIPQVIMSDNGRQFVSSEFQSFAKRLDIILQQSSPHHQQSNGKSESAVKSIKTLFKKCQRDNSDPNFALLEWRNTPMEHLNLSPAQLMFSRRCRTMVPRLQSALAPKTPANVNHGREKRQDKQTKQYNKHTKELCPLQINQSVRLQVPGTTDWVPGKVIARHGFRKYDVTVGDSVFTRNRKFLRPSSCPSFPAISSDDAPIPGEDENPRATDQPQLRRSQRVIRPPNRYGFSSA